MGAVAREDLASSQVRLVLAMIVLRRGIPVSRDELAEALWPVRPPTSWPSALRLVVSKVRRALLSVLPDCADLLVARAGSYLLEIPESVAVVVDVEQAERAVEGAEANLAHAHPRQAIAEASQARHLLGQPLLPDVEAAWADEVRRRLYDLSQRSLQALTIARLDLGQYALAVAAASELVTGAPVSEDAHRVLIQAHLTAGNRGEGLRAYERCRRQLADELGVDPSPGTEALYRDLLGEEPSHPAARPTQELPVVGREDELRRSPPSSPRSETEPVGW